jgi:hypothetical protein
MVTLLAIHIIKRDDDAGVRVIKTINVDRRQYLRELVEKRLELLGHKGYKTRFAAMFRAAAKNA